jgi:hypothetical protein
LWNSIASEASRHTIPKMIFAQPAMEESSSSDHQGDTKPPTPSPHSVGVDLTTVPPTPFEKRNWTDETKLALVQAWKEVLTVLTISVEKHRPVFNWLGYRAIHRCTPRSVECRTHQRNAMHKVEMAGMPREMAKGVIQQQPPP